MKMGTKLRAAVIGVGYLGQFHAQKYKKLSETLPVELVAVCDSFPEQAKKIAETNSVPYFLNAEELFGKVDCVTIATITPKHFELAKIFLSKGIHVNVEKPISLTVSEAKELCDLAEKNQVILAVGHSERFSPVFQELKRRMKAPKFISLQRHAPFKMRGAEVSVLHDLMVHDLDLMEALVPGEKKLLSSMTDRFCSESPDWVEATFQGTNSSKQPVQMLLGISRLVSQMVRTVKLIDQDFIYTANLQTGDLEIIPAKLKPDQTLNPEVINAGRGDNLLSETENFIQSILERKPVMVSGVDGLKTIQWVEKILSSSGRNNL